MTRQQLATKIYSSVSYIAQLEGGKKTSPSQAVLDAAAEAFSLDAAEHRHLYNLARRTRIDRQPTETPATTEAMRTLVTSDMRTAIDALNPHLVAYLDELWNVLECNTAYDKAFPGLLDEGNVLRWFFSDPRSPTVMVQWQAEAALTVAWFRALMGRHRSPTWAIDMLQELGTFPAFRELWSREEVRFGRHQPFMHMIDADTGERYSIHVQIHVAAQHVHPVQMYLGVRIPFALNVG